MSAALLAADFPPIVYDWSHVTDVGPIDASEIAPWAHMQIVRPASIVARAGNPLVNLEYSARFTVLTAADHGDPNSPNPRAEVYSGANGAGIIPLGLMLFHAWAFTPIAGNLTTWLNWFQLHGAVPGAQPLLQGKTDKKGGLYVRSNPDGRDFLIAKATPYGATVRIVAGVLPSLGSDGVVIVWASIDGGPWVLVMDITGKVGFAATYPKGALYGDAAGTGFPWVNDHHLTAIRLPTRAAAEALVALKGAPVDPGPVDPGPPPVIIPPADPCADVKAQLALALSEGARVVGERDQALTALAAATAKIAAAKADLG